MISAMIRPNTHSREDRKNNLAEEDDEEDEDVLSDEDDDVDCSEVIQNQYFPKQKKE